MTPEERENLRQEYLKQWDLFHDSQKRDYSFIGGGWEKPMSALRELQKQFLTNAAKHYRAIPQPYFDIVTFIENRHNQKEESSRRCMDAMDRLSAMAKDDKLWVKKDDQSQS